MLLLRLSGLFLLRLATRQLLALLFREPPRMWRLEHARTIPRPEGTPEDNTVF